MNIVQLNNFIEKIVSCTEVVNSFYTDSVYECWNAEEIKYGSISFCITRTQMRERTMTYDAIIYYGDRLLEDKSNRNAIWSDATQVIQSIIGTINGLEGEITISYPYDLTLFEQKFADELAGAYAEISIEVEGIGECGDLLYGYENSEEIKLESVVKTFTINGEYDIIPSDGFDAISDVKVIVDVPLQLGVYGLRSNGRSIIEPDPGYEGFKSVEVDVDVPIQSKSVEFNSNGVYDVVPDSEYAAMDNVEVNVNIPLQSKSVVYSEVGDYEIVPDDGYEALSKVDVKVSLEGKPKIPNGFRFTGGDMSLVEWDKYDWSMVYDTVDFFGGCMFSDPNWFDRFKSEFNGRIISGRGMFAGMSNNSTVTDQQYWDIDFDGLDTSKIVTSRSMFNSCVGLTSVKNLDTENVFNMREMFSSCSSLVSIPQLDTSKVTSMSYMFRDCKSLTTIPKLDTSRVNSMTYMFRNCENLTTIPSEMDFSYVSTMSSIFDGCHNLISIPEIDITRKYNMSYMFSDCWKLTEVKFKGELRSDLNVNGMFGGIKTTGVLYYDSRYDYTKIINVLPSTWTAVPYDVLN